MTILAVREGLFQALSASSSLKAKVEERIFHEQALPGAAFPYVIFSKQSGVKTRTLKTGGTVKYDVWLVKAVDRSPSSKLADEIADVIDALLDEGTFSISGMSVLDTHLVGAVSYVENDGDQQYRHSGGNYAVVLT